MRPSTTRGFTSSWTASRGLPLRQGIAFFRNYATPLSGSASQRVALGEGRQRVTSVTLSPRTTTVDVTAVVEGNLSPKSDAFTIPAGSSLTLEDMTGRDLDVLAITLNASSAVTVDVLVGYPVDYA